MIHITSEINNKLRSNKAIPTYLLSLEVEGQITTSVVDQHDQNNWMPAPNPTSDQVVLLNAHNIKALDLYSSTGQLIESWNTAVTQLNLSHVAPGAYLLRASHNDATTSVKPLFIIR
ncbi:MAG: T9SS type A sorting domain-containing protein [Saprospiraceae bacterium]|nr:T9SS type A sorting domain-containing protein [Saprospiraceae bacterium]